MKVCKMLNLAEITWMACKTYWLSGCVQKEAYISIYEKATNVLELSKKFPFKSNPSILIWIQKLQLQLIQKTCFTISQKIQHLWLVGTGNVGRKKTTKVTRTEILLHDEVKLCSCFSHQQSLVRRLLTSRVLFLSVGPTFNCWVAVVASHTSRLVLMEPQAAKKISPEFRFLSFRRDKQGCLLKIKFSTPFIFGRPSIIPVLKFISI